ncbi:MAG: hypothetical protein MRY21_08590 [Simkaniaceae bacterium]|nr:hypothetical protein [Simkaniaceae bacterium]
MIKHLLFPLLAVIHLTASPSCPQSDEPTLPDGTYAYRSRNFTTLTIDGFLRLIDCKISRTLKIDGTLEAVRCQFGCVVGTGKIYLSQCKVQNRTEIVGELSAKNSRFLNTVSLTTSESVFMDSQIKDLRVRPLDQRFQEIYLHDTTVLGNIVFEKGNGRVYLDRHAAVRGKVQGGTVFKRGSKE